MKRIPAMVLLIPVLFTGFLSLARFEGGQGDLTVDRFGDVARPIYMFAIKNGIITVWEERL